MHVEQNVQKNKHQIFPGDSDMASHLAGELNSMIEKVKNHSVTVSTPEVGKTLIKKHLQDIGQETAARYMEKIHLCHKWTLVEMNAGTAAGGGVPCQSNPIGRKNLDQKQRSEWKRTGVVGFLEHAAED